jgi:GNAT superfamily N-acetyltransferase
MEGNEKIRLIAGETDENAFRKIARYCFNDLYGWIERIFPLSFGDRAWGSFSGNVLESGLIARAFESMVFGTWQKMSGIACVESLPEHRNKSNITALMNRALAEEKERGAVFSALYPFKFRFYEKFGYGYSGGFLNSTFAPDDLAIQTPAGEFVPFGETDE